MDVLPIKRALISVFDKKGIVLFARSLVNHGVELISTGGTKNILKKRGIPIKDVSSVTGFPELLDGRVKTLHPKIHASILARRDNKAHMNQIKKYSISPIDLVVVNLYPFQKTAVQKQLPEDEVLEMIDIGGPTMLRGAAKNYHCTAPVCCPEDYDLIIKELNKHGGITLDTRKYLSEKVFKTMYRYDFDVYCYLHGKCTSKEHLDLHYVKVCNLRYGENPHQKAVFFARPDNRDHNITSAKVLHGKELSFNNILDGNDAIELVREFTRPTAVFVKHTNPCGVSTADTIERAFQSAYSSDPLSAFGSVVAINRRLSTQIAEYILKNKLFIELLAAPSFEKKALNLIFTRKNIRILELGKLSKPRKRRDIKKVAGGILVQTSDISSIKEKDLKIVTRKKPTKSEIQNLLFASIIVKHVKSNAIVFAKNETTTGIGAGQMSRVDAVFLAQYKGGDKVKGSVMASDAFFPFEDAIIEAHKAGITSIIQPGGSIRDKEVIEKADEFGMSMVFTGIRNFKH